MSYLGLKRRVNLFRIRETPFLGICNYGLVRQKNPLGLGKFSFWFSRKFHHLLIVHSYEKQLVLRDFDVKTFRQYTYYLGFPLFHFSTSDIWVFNYWRKGQLYIIYILYIFNIYKIII